MFTPPHRCLPPPPGSHRKVYVASFLRPRLSGMTGTAFTEAKEFEEVYKLKTVALTAIRKWIFEPPWLVVFEKKRGCPNFLGGYWNSRSVRRFLAKFGCQWTKNTWSIIFVGGSSQWVSRRIEGCFGGVSLSARKTLTILRTRFYGWYSFWARKSHPKCPGLQFVWFFSSHLPAALYCPLSSQPNCQMKWAAQVLSNQNNHKQIRDHSITFFFWGDQTSSTSMVILRDFPQNMCIVWVGVILKNQEKVAKGPI